MSTPPTADPVTDTTRLQHAYPVSACLISPSPPILFSFSHDTRFPPRALVNGCADARLPPIRDGISRQRPRSVLTQPGQPVTFATGVFARRTIRAEIEEIQKADLGRKYACRLPSTTHPVPELLPFFLLLLPFFSPYEDTPAKTSALSTRPPSSSAVFSISSTDRRAPRSRLRSIQNR